MNVATTFSEEVSVRNQLEVLEEKEISVVRYPFQCGLAERASIIKYKETYNLQNNQILVKYFSKSHFYEEKYFQADVILF